MVPEGDQIFVTTGSGPGGFANYVWSGATWTRAPDLNLPAGFSYISRPSSRPNRRALAGGYELVEDAEGNWSVLRSHPGLHDHSGHLSADGLRVTDTSSFGETQRVILATRQSIDDEFTAYDVVGPPTTTLAFDPFLTDDCRRLYYTSNGSVSFDEPPNL